MSKDPAVLFYPSDFLAGTMLMTNEEVGAYIRLLCLQREQGHLPRDVIDRICIKPMPSVMAKFDIDENGLYFQHRMEEEIKRRDAYCHSRSQNRTQGVHMKNICETYDLHMGNRNRNINENIYISKDNKNILKNDAQYAKNMHSAKEDLRTRFAEFWNAYPRKTDKRKAEAAFIRLKPSDELVAQMIAALERQKQSDQWTRDGGRFIPHPTTWLNGRRWEDEIEAPLPPTNPTQGARKSEPEEKPRFGNFDVKDAFKKAMERTYGGNIDVDKELERMKEK